ncbi:uroporphyrinogen-III C-methyltransferase [Effusibacillus lacus]|uniref:Uroporphyrinogen-III C-methyltransferase n=1 Tax=Effusibacillus lacus TaxID=1348429 RepID=A0A292YQ37_9BACL|nr:uroporphyrinogen-III C-methyltransferase [Effusibacillus lacus]TCS75700.1 uroporphyrinogen-III C-methyltransferase [Effusibacillus lacus]GAX91019.1 uroporphyrinogen-III C-methyltransferase [Effusibacillus lacus]
MGKGKVYLTGAGPGDPKLITLKGLETIKCAEVLIYDRLVAPDLLEYASPDAELVYAGKLPENHTLRQEEINQLLVLHALQGKTVTRLKGGDPFVFGRGGEEAVVLAEHGIEYEIVPGVTSAVAVPAYAGIPVTYRGVASAFSVIAGFENCDKPGTSIDWARYASPGETLIILMGIGNLPSITGNLMAHGRPADTPAALVRWGTYTHQETLFGTLGDIAGKAAAVQFQNPAVIVVGEVVNLHEKIAWFQKGVPAVQI